MTIPMAWGSLDPDHGIPEKAWNKKIALAVMPAMGEKSVKCMLQY
jgi:hypothetical protein